MRRADTGFTLTELVLAIVIATILSVFAIARINTADFNTEGFANQLAATIRYAQKIAVSQRRNIAVTISASAVSLTYPDAANAPVRQPPGTDPFTISVPSGVVLSGTLSATAFTFSALGRPSASGTVTVTGGTEVRNIVVEAETGYVH